MATKRMIVRARKLETRYADQSKRDSLRAVIRDKSTDPKSRMEAVFALHARPRDESRARWMKRCHLCGRAHAVYRKFGLCRMCIRDCFTKGYLPGVVKSSW